MTPPLTSYRYRLAPVSLLAMAIALGVGVFVIVTILAQQRPWLGIKLIPIQGDVGVQVSMAKGPSVEIPTGIIITTVEDHREQVSLSSFDLIAEPDGAMGDFANYRRFLERQERLARIQSADELVFTAEDGQRFVVHPALDGRPLADLPADFWVQCAVGLIAWLVSAAVFAFRPKEASARYLLLSGAATLLFAPAAAVYTTRELAVPSTLLQWASDLNFLGGSLFTASFVGLLLVYPRRIAPKWVGPSVIALFIIWFVAQQIGVFESMNFARRFLVMIGVAATFALAAVHWRGSKQDPLARAKLQWFLLSWVVGTGVFALFILLPQSFGVDTSSIQGYAFLLFLLVYGGLAMGILRYRLFELGDWWRRVIVWAVLTLLLILLDLFFLYSLHLSRGTSLAVALLLCGLVWLPIRGWIWHRFTRQNERNAPELFGQVMDVALAPTGKENETDRWLKVVAAVFEPLDITSIDQPTNDKVVIQENGLSMRLPAVERLPELHLTYARNGQGLFHPRDAKLASELIAMVKHAFDSLAAYQKGVGAERKRIARDLHDNIGAQLLSALHCEESDLKDRRIRESLTDLRGVINHVFDGPDLIGQTFAELRIETAQRLEASGIALIWTPSEFQPIASSPALSHEMRSIIREAVSNVIKHSRADEVTIITTLDSKGLCLEVSDNGQGFDISSSRQGNGINNIRKRLESLNASFTLDSFKKGTTLKAIIPIETTSPNI